MGVVVLSDCALLACLAIACGAALELLSPGSFASWLRQFDRDDDDDRGRR